MRLDDPQCYYAQTLNIVSLDSPALTAWRANSKFDLFLATAALETPSYNSKHLVDLASEGDEVESSRLTREAALRATLTKMNLPEDQIDRAIDDMRAAMGNDVWKLYEADIERFEKAYVDCSFSGNRQVIEYVFVRDDPSCAALSIDDLWENARTRNDKRSESRYEHETTTAESLGIRRMELIQELPLTLAAYGYTRFLNDPYATTAEAGGAESRATLRSFDPVDDKVPLYTARNTTEAFLFELDPAVLATFLCLNTGLLMPDIGRSETAAWKAWLLEACPLLLSHGEAHLTLYDSEKARGREVDVPSALLFGALHSISHAIKNTAHRFVGIDGDGLAEYLFPAFGAGMIYASANVQFTLGGIDSVFRSNLSQWLGAVRDYAGLCSFDPVCADAGAACHACMYPKFGCQFFNRTVSRAFLIGGRIGGWAKPLVGLWSQEVRERLAQMPVTLTL